MNIDKRFKLILLFIFLVQVFALLFFNRNKLFTSYDYSYWKDRYEHSQWQLPASKRIIGDDGLYAYVGINILNGKDLTTINPEAPPVAKYLIGFSIYLFNNPVFYALFVGLITTYVFYLLSKTVLKNDNLALFATVVLIMDPLFFSQFFGSWIDITQLIFFILSLIFVFKLEKSGRKSLFSSAAGLFLGLFMQTKFPVLFPLIFLYEAYFFFKNKYFREFLFYLCGLLFGNLIPYIGYFIEGHTLIDLLKYQKYVFSFYAKSKLSANHLSLMESLFFGNFPIIAGKGFDRVLEWTILWPLSFVSMFFVTFGLIFKKNKEQLLKSLGIMTILIFLLFLIIPSYPRYLLIVLPFMYLFLAYLIDMLIKNKAKYLLFIVIVMYGFLNSCYYLFPKPDTVLKDFYYNFSNQYFQDIYEEDLTNKPNFSERNDFFVTAKKAMQGLEVSDIQIKQLSESFSPFSDRGSVKIQVIYKTQNLGEFVENKTINLIKMGSEWKINWDWGILLNGYKKDYLTKTEIEPGKRGAISINGEIVAEDSNGYLISVNPSKIDLKREQEMLSFLQDISGIKAVCLQNVYLENIIPNTFVPLFTTQIPLSNKQLEELKTFPGVRVADYPSRIYYGNKLSQFLVKNTLFDEECTRIYSSTNYRGVAGVEKKYDSVLYGYDGGWAKIIDRNGNSIRTIFAKQPKNGQDINLNSVE